MLLTRGCSSFPEKLWITYHACVLTATYFTKLLMNPLKPHTATWMDNIDSITKPVHTTWITSAIHCHQSTCVSVAGSLWVWSRQISRIHLSTVITKLASNLRHNKTSSPKFAYAHLLNVQQGCMCFKWQTGAKVGPVDSTQGWMFSLLSLYIGLGYYASNYLLMQAK